MGPAVLPRGSTFHAAAEGLARQLHAVADAQHGQSEVEDLRIALRRPGLVDARRPAGENQPFGTDLSDPLGRDIVANDLAINLLLANATGDQLGILRPEIEDEHLLAGNSGHGRSLGENLIL